MVRAPSEVRIEVRIGELREVLTGWLCRTDATAICENLE